MIIENNTNKAEPVAKPSDGAQVPPGNESQQANPPSPKDIGEQGKIIKKEGRVIEALPNAFFKVLLEDGSEIMGFLSGKMRLNRIKILPGDKVTIEMTSYDLKKGRIVYRLK